jgi:hypothetical protein
MSHQRPTRTLTIRPLESLDERIVPSGVGISPSANPANEVIVATRGGQVLGAIYQEYVKYEQGGGQGKFHPSQSSRIPFNGTAVGVDIRSGVGNFDALVGKLRGLGMEVTATSPQNGIVEGYLPISRLPAVADNGDVIGLSPTFRPILRGSRFS